MSSSLEKAVLSSSLPLKADDFIEGNGPYIKVHECQKINFLYLELDLLSEIITDSDPCYILFRKTQDTSYDWIFISYVPESAKVNEG
jgi:hypothetical protein